jgi:hypothetical protein
VLIELSGFAIGHTELWQAFAAHVRSLTM